MATPAGIEIHPLTSERWDDLVRVLGPNGARGGCWCMAWRFTSSESRRSSIDARREALVTLVDAGTPTGLLAYLDGEPAGWCSVGPRASFGRLVRSRTLLPPEDGPAWATTCFFIRRGFRRAGIAKALLHGAVTYAAAAGALVLDAYPDLNTGARPNSRGSIPMFRAAGFEEVASLSTYFVSMRRDLTRSP